MTEKHDDATTRAASYAVGALTDAERVQLETEADADPRLAAEVREFSETTVMLGLAVAPVAPSDGLRGRLLDALDTHPQSAPVAPVRELRRPWYSRPLTGLVAAAAAILIGVVGIAVATTVPAEAPSVVDQIVAAADSERITAEVDGGGTITLVWSFSLERAALVAADLAAPPSGRTYQLWFIDEEGSATSAGTFEPDADGAGSVALAGEIEQGDTVGMTIEPDGGSPSPTTAPIAVVATA